ncbi:MAG: hypothetical protein KA764_23045 [Anaerolineales bacterium]|nr:hypothetical protein [Anaerolineales bacterium]
MRLNPFFMPVLVIGLLLGTVAGAQALGQWSVSGKTSVNLEQLTPADLKGWMTLQQVMDGVAISQADLYALMAIPADIAPTTALKDLEPIVPGFEVSLLRERLAAWQSGEPVPAAETPAAASQVPAPTATLELAATPELAPTAFATPGAAAEAAPTAADHLGAGGGSGGGPTPLPAGQILPADQIKGRMTLAEISAQCAVPLDQLLAALGLPANTDPALKVKDLVGQDVVTEVTVVQTAVAALQAP